MKIRGFGDILGFKQSGIKNFKLADPVHNSDLFLLAEKEIRRIENQNGDISKFKPLIKLYDRADIINDIAQDCLLDVPAETINLEASSKLISK